MSRPFARTFDLISSEYGWSEKKILDLTYDRFRQIRDVIQERQEERRRETVVLQERATRGVMQAVYGAAGNQDGFNQAGRWELVGGYGTAGGGPQEPKRQERELPAAEKLGQLFGAPDMRRGEVEWSEIERMAAEIRAKRDAGD